MSKRDEQLARMKGLMKYGLVTESKKNPVEYSLDGPDGKTYAIVRESTKYYIKNAPQGSELVSESFDYIGGFMNKKRHEYHSYNEALKQLELKMRSLNEAYGVNKSVETLNPSKKGDVIVEMTDAMKASLARYRQIMNNTSSILKENATISVNNTGVPEAPKTTSFSPTLGEPFTQKAEAILDNDLKATASDPEKQGDPFGEKDKAEEYTDAKYVPDGSVANKKPSGGKVVRVNEGDCTKEECFEETIEDCEEWGSYGLPATAGIGEVGDGEPFEKEVSVNEDTEVPGGFDAVQEDDEIDLDDLDTDVDDLDYEDPLEDEELDDEDSEEAPEMDPEEEDDVEDFEDELDDEDPEDEEFDDEDFATEESVEELKAEIEELRAIIEDLIDDDDDFDDEELGDDEEPEGEMEMEDSVEEFPDDEEEFELDGESEDELDPKQYVESIVRSSMNLLEDVSFGDTPDVPIKKFRKEFISKVEEELDGIENLNPQMRQTIIAYANEMIRLSEEHFSSKDVIGVGQEAYKSMDIILNNMISTFGSDHPITNLFRQLANFSFERNDRGGLYPNAPKGGFTPDPPTDPSQLVRKFADYRSAGVRDINYILSRMDQELKFFKDKANSAGNKDYYTPEQREGLSLLINNFANGVRTFVKYIKARDIDNAKVIYQNSIKDRYKKVKAGYDENDRLIALFKVLYRFCVEILKRNKTEEGFLDQMQGNSEIVPESHTLSGRLVKEEGTKLNVFGQHPGYRKKPMSLPATGSDKEGNYRDWNDESVYSEEPFGKEIGNSDPYTDVVKTTVDAIMENLKKKR